MIRHCRPKKLACSRGYIEVIPEQSTRRPCHDARCIRASNDIWSRAAWPPHLARAQGGVHGDVHEQLARKRLKASSPHGCPKPNGKKHQRDHRRGEAHGVCETRGTRARRNKPRGGSAGAREAQRHECVTTPMPTNKCVVRPQVSTTHKAYTHVTTSY